MTPSVGRRVGLSVGLGVSYQVMHNGLAFIAGGFHSRLNISVFFDISFAS